MVRKTKGVRLMEMLLVLAIGAAIIMAAVRYFGITNRNVRVTHAMQQIQILTKASYEWLQAQKQDDFSSANSGILISMHQLIDAGLIKDSDTNTMDPWAGAITIQPGSDPTRVKITLARVPQKDCKNLARHLDEISQITMPTCSGPSNDYSGEF